MVIIANIKNRDTIVLSPYFFTDEGRRYEKVEYVVLDSNNPYSNDDEILGAEEAEYLQNETVHSGASLTITENQQSTPSISQQHQRLPHLFTDSSTSTG